MELGQYQLQIFVSLLVILGAAFVALICDFLKGNNERLRELTIELKVRREEEQRHGRTMTAQSAPAKRVAEPAPVAEAPAPAVAASRPERKLNAPAARVSTAAPRRAASADALAAMERGARLAAAPGSKMPAQAAVPVPVMSETPSTPPPMPAKMVPPPMAANATIETSAASQASMGKKDWGALLAHRASAVQRATETTIDVTPVATHSALPAGFHDSFELGNLLQTHQTVTGLVVSIGVSTNSKTGGAVPENVTTLVRSLIGSDDFACPSGQDEFLLIYPRLNGASAQRQLSQVAQQLWDFQLRSLGTTSILFSWGGVEVASEPLEEAIASASERMRETRRGRKLITMPLRQAV